MWWSVAFPTWIRFFGVFFTLASDNEDENKEEDEDEADQSYNDQEPPLLVERRHFLGWKNTNIDQHKHSSTANNMHRFSKKKKTQPNKQTKTSIIEKWISSSKSN